MRFLRNLIEGKQRRRLTEQTAEGEGFMRCMRLLADRLRQLECQIHLHTNRESSLVIFLCPFENKLTFLEMLAENQMFVAQNGLHNPIGGWFADIASASKDVPESDYRYDQFDLIFPITLTLAQKAELLAMLPGSNEVMATTER
jgi:hypothetical protein